MQFLRRNTATRVTVGPFLDKTDGITPETGLTATNEKLTFTVDDGGVPTLVLDTTATASGGSNDLVHITGDDAGYYDLELAAANVNYAGRANLAITYATDHCPVFHEYTILPENVYDSLFNTVGTRVAFGVIDEGTAQAATATTLQLRSAAAFADNELNGATILITGGSAGVGQRAIITGYVGSTDTATVDTWPTTPSGTITYMIFATAPSSTTALPRVDLRQIAGSTVSTSSAQLGVNVVNVGGSAVAATSGMMNVNAIQISGDSTAADNLEAMLDGTGSVTLTTNVTGNITGNLSGSVGSVTGAVGSVTGAVGSVTTVSDKTGYRLSSTGVDDILRTALTESYAADGAAGTLSQILFAIQQFLQEKSISGTTMTVKKLDGSTTAMTFTLNDATTPTSTTRAS